MAHDFKEFPELTNNQMDFYYFDSPHRQIFEDIRARVTKVTDGDTIWVKWDGRDFDFKIRMAKLAAPEIKEAGGRESQRWLEGRILGKDVDVLVDPTNRVGRWGRLIGDVVEGGISLGEESIQNGHAVNFDEVNNNPLPEIEALL